MTYFINLLTRQWAELNFSNPLVFTDFFIAILLVVGFLIYLHRFPVFRVVVGILFLLVCSLLALVSGFIFTALVFGFTGGLILFSLPSIFAPEVRHYLEKLGRFYHLRLPSISKKRKNEKLIRDLVDAVFDLADKKIGALIVLQRKTNLGHLVESGILIDAHLGSKLLSTIFYPNTALHDGAVVISDNRILAAKCIIHIRHQIKLDPPFGLRHRAGIAITQETDAVSLIVSEQRGEISLAENGKLETNCSRARLSERLFSLLPAIESKL